MNIREWTIPLVAFLLFVAMMGYMVYVGHIEKMAAIEKGCDK